MDEIMSTQAGLPLSSGAQPPPPTGQPGQGPTAHAVDEEPGGVTTNAALENIAINKIEVLSNRLVPGSDGSIEHVVIGNNAVTVIRSTPLKGRVRITKDNVFVGGVSCKILLTGLAARVDTVRHLVGGEMPVYGGLFLSKQRNAPIKHFGRIIVGSPSSVVEHLIEQHCEAGRAPNLKSLAAELDGMFLPYDKLSGKISA